MRYLIGFICIVALYVIMGLATGHGADLPYAVVFGLGICAAGYLGSRVNRGVSWMPSKTGLVYLLLVLAFAVVILPVEAYRLYEGIGSGRLLVSTIGDWSVSWSDRPIGFAAALLMHLIIVTFWAGGALLSVLEIKQRYDRRAPSS